VLWPIHFYEGDGTPGTKASWNLTFLGVAQTIGLDIPTGMSGIDIGPKSLALFSETIQNSKTILLNCPMGIFEIKDAAKGAFAIAEAIGETIAKNQEAISIIRGGDSLKGINKSGHGNDGDKSHHTLRRFRQRESLSRRIFG
jgi:3-phosphoglycerate kinase